MSFYELDRPAAPAPGIVDRLGAVVARGFAPVRNAGRSAMHSLAYARMMQVMHAMDDETLARIGITRAQIPAHVDRCLTRTPSI